MPYGTRPYRNETIDRGPLRVPAVVKSAIMPNVLTAGVSGDRNNAALGCSDCMEHPCNMSTVKKSAEKTRIGGKLAVKPTSQMADLGYYQSAIRATLNTGSDPYGPRHSTRSCRTGADRPDRSLAWRGSALLRSGGRPAGSGGAPRCCLTFRSAVYTSTSVRPFEPLSVAPTVVWTSVTIGMGATNGRSANAGDGDM